MTKKTFDERCLEAEKADGIITNHIYPPIPLRQFDWVAYRNPEQGLRGWGKTEIEAVEDLLNLEEDQI